MASYLRNCFHCQSRLLGSSAPQVDLQIQRETRSHLRRRLIASPTLPLEAVVVTERVQQLFARLMKDAKLSPRDVRTVHEYSAQSSTSPYAQHPSKPSAMRAPPSTGILALSQAVTTASGRLAANVHVMAELRRCYPAFMPRSLLDFRSGTCAPVSAVARVFRNHETPPLEAPANGDENIPSQPVDQGMAVSNSFDQSLESMSGVVLEPPMNETHSSDALREGERKGRAKLDWEAEGKSSIQNVTLVEGSSAVRKIGLRMLQNDDFVSKQSDRPAEIRELSSLKELRALNNIQRSFDIVSASHTLTDFLTNEEYDQHDESSMVDLLERRDVNVSERRLKACILSLWRHVDAGGVLVLVERGDQAGFESILFARTVLMNMGKKQQHAGIVDKVDPDCSEPPFCDSSTPEIIAPCLHSQKCPLDGNTSKTRTCRFVQRFNRPPFMRAVLPKADGFEDEYFSYLIVRKGPSRVMPSNVATSTVQLGDDELSAEQFTNEIPGWGRLVRTPLRRDKHIVLDACTRDGKLERRSVSRKSVPQQIYMVAKRARWGDVWPIRPTSNPQPVHF